MIKLKNAALLRDACLVNGRWLKAADGKTIAVENPANSMITVTFLHYLQMR